MKIKGFIEITKVVDNMLIKTPYIKHTLINVDNIVSISEGIDNGDDSGYTTICTNEGVYRCTESYDEVIDMINDSKTV